MEETTHPLTLTVEQAAKVLGIGRSTAYELVHTGDIPSLRLGRRIVVPTAKLAEMLAPMSTTEASCFGDTPKRDLSQALAHALDAALQSPTLF